MHSPSTLSRCNMFTAAVLVSSDRAFKGVYPDKSGVYLKEELARLGYNVVDCSVVPDDFDTLKEKLENYVKDEINLVLTSGGTGFSPRDVVPEATKAVIDREVPGVSEAIRAKSLEITKNAMLSRATSGLKNKTWIINLPGSRKAVEESLEIIAPVLEHGLGILLGIADN